MQILSNFREFFPPENEQFQTDFEKQVAYKKVYVYDECEWKWLHYQCS